MKSDEQSNHYTTPEKGKEATCNIEHQTRPLMRSNHDALNEFRAAPMPNYWLRCYFLYQNHSLAQIRTQISHVEK